MLSNISSTYALRAKYEDDINVLEVINLNCVLRPVLIREHDSGKHTTSSLCLKGRAFLSKISLLFI